MSGRAVVGRGGHVVVDLGSLVRLEAAGLHVLDVLVLAGVLAVAELVLGLLGLALALAALQPFLLLDPSTPHRRVLVKPVLVEQRAEVVRPSFAFATQSFVLLVEGIVLLVAVGPLLAYLLRGLSRVLLVLALNL